MVSPATSPEHVHVQNMGTWNNDSVLNNRTGESFIEDKGAAFSNLPTEHIEDLKQRAFEQILTEIRRNKATQYKRVQDTFNQRLEADRAIFEGFNLDEIQEMSRVMTQQLLIFLPTRISADVTTDASVMLQAHYGSLHVYWECFFDVEDQGPRHSTLNVTQDKQILLTKGSDFITIQQNLIDLMIPLSKATFANALNR